MLQFLKPERIRNDGYLGVANAKDTLLVRTHQLDGFPVINFPYKLVGLKFQLLFVLALVDLVQRGRVDVVE